MVHNRYLAPEHPFTGDDIATLLALGFEAPGEGSRNLFRVFEPTCDADFEAIVGLVRTVVTDFFHLPPMHPLQMVASSASRRCRDGSADQKRRFRPCSRGTRSGKRLSPTPSTSPVDGCVAKRGHIFFR